MRLIIALLVLVAGGGIGCYFDNYLHIEDPVVYVCLGIGMTVLYRIVR